MTLLGGNQTMYELGVSFGLAHEFRVWFNYSTIVCWYSYRCMTWVLHRTLRFVIVVEKLNCKSTGIFLMESFVDSQDFDIKDRQMQVRYIVEGSYNVDDDKLWQLITVMTFGYLCWQLFTCSDITIDEWLWQPDNSHILTLRSVSLTNQTESSSQSRWRALREHIESCCGHRPGRRYYTLLKLRFLMLRCSRGCVRA